MSDFGSHAYWRVTGLWDNWQAWSAIAFKDGSGSSIATTGGTAIESNHSSTFAAANAFDGSDTTFWESGDQGQYNWVGYHFASAQTVMQVGFQRRAKASQDNADSAFTVSVEWSDDGTTWVSVGYVMPRLTADVMSWFDLSGALP